MGRIKRISFVCLCKSASWNFQTSCDIWQCFTVCYFSLDLLLNLVTCPINFRYITVAWFDNGLRWIFFLNFHALITYLAVVRVLCLYWYFACAVSTNLWMWCFTFNVNNATFLAFSSDNHAVASRVETKRYGIKISLVWFNELFNDLGSKGRDQKAQSGWLRYTTFESPPILILVRALSPCVLTSHFFHKWLTVYYCLLCSISYRVLIHLYKLQLIIY